ncbi:MAG: segregation/condensation protein A [Bifidobacteriaceae bacterium]|jgi:segregation and condensation protein A|nr:segregation/condensation protein A [Bifidobacteriaceae bacterium]
MSNVTSQPAIENGDINPDQDSIAADSTNANSESTATGTTNTDQTGFEVHTEIFDGPFDLLLNLISKNKMEITKISISSVTDEFINYVKNNLSDNDLEQKSSFVLMASMLLEIKSAQLIPNNSDADITDSLQALKSHELLFAKLIQYKAFKDIADDFEKRIATTKPMINRDAILQIDFRKILGDAKLPFADADEFKDFSIDSFNSLLNVGKLSSEHVHLEHISFTEQSKIVTKVLSKHKEITFVELAHNAKSILEIVGRFLILLELYRRAAVHFSQDGPLAPLHISATNPNNITNEVFDYEEFK